MHIFMFSFQKTYVILVFYSMPQNLIFEQHQLIHSNICEPLQINTHEDCKYFIILTKCCFVYLMKHTKWKHSTNFSYRTLLRNKPIKNLEYWDLIKEVNINQKNVPNISKRRASRGNSPNIHDSTKQSSKRKNKTLIKVVLVMLTYVNLPKILQKKALMTTNYL